MATPKRPPLVAVLIARDPAMREAIVANRKRITIREGYRLYKPGMTVMICCHLEPWCVQADIVAVRHCQLSKVVQEEWEADGYVSKTQMAEDLRRFYPKITWSSPVTIIKWENVRGQLVDDYNQEHILL